MKQAPETLLSALYETFVFVKKEADQAANEVYQLAAEIGGAGFVFSGHNNVPPEPKVSGRFSVSSRG